MAMDDVTKMGKKAKEAAQMMAKASTDQKNEALLHLADNLTSAKEAILEANELDRKDALIAGLNNAMIDRLTLKNCFSSLVEDVRKVAKLPDPTQEEFDQTTLANGLKVCKRRTPIGVLGVIYESRPNVTIDVASVTIKTGNCVILRGGSETLQTNLALMHPLKKALQSAKLPLEAIQMISTTDREQVGKMLRLHESIDLIIPRGGAKLHSYCRENSTIPVITGGIGICHLFVDETADQERSLPVIYNAKTQRPTVCNSLDTLLVHADIAKEFIPKVMQALMPAKVEFRVDKEVWNLLQADTNLLGQIVQAVDEDWETEWLCLILGIKIVKNLEEAIQHIRKYSTGHSDGILTSSQEHGARFLNEIDSAAVYVNASTRFTDGGQLGLGAEVAISTQKLHARGPMGLKELTTYKWIIQGDYHVRS